jgi:hypothetical protein
MGEDLAAVHVTRSYTLAGTNIAIFTFMPFFLYPQCCSSVSQASTGRIHNSFIEAETLCQTTIRNPVRQIPTVANFF